MGPHSHQIHGSYRWASLVCCSRRLFSLVRNFFRKCHAIEVFHQLFARWGVCRSIVSDNRSQFTSNECLNYCQDHSIKVIHATPYHSRTNGLVERAICTLKWRYRKSAKSITGSFFSLLFRNSFWSIEAKLQLFMQKYHHNSRLSACTFKVNKKVWYHWGTREWNKDHIERKVRGDQILTCHTQY